MQDDVSGYKTKNIKLHLEVMSNISRVFLVPYLLTLEFFRIFFPDGRILRPIRNVQEEETCNQPSKKCTDLIYYPLVNLVVLNSCLIVLDKPILEYAINDHGYVQNTAHHLPDKLADNLKHLHRSQHGAANHAYDT